MFPLMSGSFSLATTMTTARRTSGPAPFLVVFDAFLDSDIPSPPVNETGSPDPGLYQWQWYFGDDDTAVWSTDGKSKNRGSGPITAHVYDTPGTYVAYLRVLTDDGFLYTFAETITVTDPDVVWATEGTDLFFVDPSLGSGADSNPGTQASPWGTIEKAFNATGVFSVSTARLRVKKGTTGSKSTATNLGTKAGPYLIDTYGSGDDPIINITGSGNAFNCNKATEKLVVMDLDIRGTGTQNGIIPGTDCLFYRISINTVSSPFTTSKAFGTKNGNGIVECNLGTSIDQYGTYYEYGAWVAYMGNTVDSGGASGEYVIRPYLTHSYIGHNILQGGGAGKGYMRCAGFWPTGSPNRGGEETTETAEYNVISDNIGQNPGGSETNMFMFGVTNSGNDQHFTNSLIERNRIVMPVSTSSGKVGLECDSVSGCVIRNNVVILTTTPAGKVGRVLRSGVGSPTPTDNTVINNVGVCNVTYTGTGWAIGTAATDTYVANNAIFSTGASTGDADGVGTSGSTNTTLATNVVYNITDLFDIATGEPLASAVCVNAGTVSDYMVDDFDGLGIFAIRNDVGAFEIGTPSDPWEYLAVAPVPAPPVESPSPGSLLGVNMDRTHFNSVPIFKDFFKQCGHTGTGALVPWLARDSGTFGSNATSMSAMVDGTGYPKVDLPYDAGGGEGPAVLETRMVALEDAAYPSGTYYVYWDGTATIGIAGDATPVTLTASGQTFEVVTPTTTGIVLRILTTSGTRVTNIRVVHSDYISDYETDPFFPETIRRLQTFRRKLGPGNYLPLLLRTFHLSRTNGKRDSANDPNVVTWASRTQTNWASQATSNGMAWEYIFDLINTLRATGWICLHHQADADYQTQLATLAFTTLDSDLEVFIQWSNEASFNGAFDQCTFTRTQGAAAGFTGTAAEQGNKYLAKVAAEFFGRWFDVWGTESDRVYTVLDTQASSVTVTNRLLGYYNEATIDSVDVNPVGYRLDYAAFAPYFGLETSTADRFGEDFIDGDAHGLVYPTATNLEAAAVVRDFYRPLAYTNITNQVAEIADWNALSSVPTTGVLPCAYESGPSYTSDDAADQADATLTAWLISFSTFHEQYDICREYLTEWDTLTDAAPLCWYTFAGPPYTGANMYGAMRSLSDTLGSAPKWRAFYYFASDIPDFLSRSFRTKFLRWSIRGFH